MKVSKSIWDVRFSRKELAQDDWKTINGAHVELNEQGDIIRGANGKFNGSNYHQAKAAKEERQNKEFSKNASRAELKKQVDEIAAAGDAHTKGAKIIVGEKNREIYKEELQKKYESLMDQSKEFYDNADAAWDYVHKYVPINTPKETRDAIHERKQRKMVEGDEWRAAGNDARKRAHAVYGELNRYQHKVYKNGKQMLEIDAGL